MVRKPSIGGYHRVPGVPQLSLFIRDQLSAGPTWAFRLWAEYTEAVQAVPLQRQRGKRLRKAISYDGFRRYLHAARKLGLIEYVIDPDTGEIITEEPEVFSGMLKEGRLYFRLVPGAESDPAWNAILEAVK